LLARDMPSIEMILHSSNPYDAVNLPQPRRRGGQTMGFVPAIDSFEEMIGQDWGRRREILIWAAGSKLGFRYQVKTPSLRMRDISNVPHRLGRLDVWGVYHEENAVEGLDDFTTIKLFRRVNDTIRFRHGMPSFSVLVGTASGELSILDLTIGPNATLICNKKRSLQMGNRALIRCVDLSPSSRYALGASTDGIVNLFDCAEDLNSHQPIGSLNSTVFGHLWSGRFLSDDTIALGTGKSTIPLHTYRLRPFGFSKEPLRIWSTNDSNKPDGGISSVTSILPLPLSSSSSATDRDIFLSGRTDGTIKLHDLRSPRDWENEYFDPFEDSGVYSLASKGRERIVSGGSRNTLLKFFDLRVDGGRSYNYTTGLKTINNSNRRSKGTSAGWTVFVHPHEPVHHSRRPWNLRPLSRLGLMSPIYSISTPSPISPTLYVGLTERIVQIDITDVFDRFPDPNYYRQAPRMNPRDIWDINYSSLEMSYYDHDPPNLLRRQTKSWGYNPNHTDIELDYRWKCISDP
jgi:WD40 repeat protein